MPFRLVAAASLGHVAAFIGRSIRRYSISTTHPEGIGEEAQMNTGRKGGPMGVIVMVFTSIPSVLHCFTSIPCAVTTKPCGIGELRQTLAGPVALVMVHTLSGLRRPPSQRCRSVRMSTTTHPGWIGVSLQIVLMSGGEPWEAAKADGVIKQNRVPSSNTPMKARPVE